MKILETEESPLCPLGLCGERKCLEDTERFSPFELRFLGVLLTFGPHCTDSTSGTDLKHEPI